MRGRTALITDDVLDMAISRYIFLRYRELCYVIIHMATVCQAHGSRVSEAFAAQRGKFPQGKAIGVNRDCQSGNECPKAQPSPCCVYENVSVVRILASSTIFLLAARCHHMSVSCAGLRVTKKTSRKTKIRKKVRRSLREIMISIWKGFGMELG